MGTAVRPKVKRRHLGPRDHEVAAGAERPLWMPEPQRGVVPGLVPPQPWWGAATQVASVDKFGGLADPVYTCSSSVSS